MSGGVDSALAAALLKRAGHRIHGLHFVLPSPDDITQQRISRIREISEYIKIPLEILDLRATFEKELIDPFVDAYLNGLTPNPCVRCNPLIKFEQMHRHVQAEPDTTFKNHFSSGIYDQSGNPLSGPRTEHPLP